MTLYITSQHTPIHILLNLTPKNHASLLGSVVRMSKAVLSCSYGYFAPLTDMSCQQVLCYYTTPCPQLYIVGYYIIFIHILYGHFINPLTVDDALSGHELACAFALKKTRASRRNVGKVPNHVVSWYRRTIPLLIPEPAEKPSLYELVCA